MRILVTGATGKVGQALLPQLLDSTAHTDTEVIALCHQRLPPPHPRLEIVHGSIADRDTAARAIAGVDHVVHMATCKETPEAVMDVTVKGLFWLLEEARGSSTLKQFMLIGGDAAVGHFFYPRSTPVTEGQPHSAYPGCYALSKVIEEVMLEQYRIQYELPCCCLRAPWIMEKDDFKYSLSFGDDMFGGPKWNELVDANKAREYHAQGTVPLMQDEDGRPIRRNFVHLNDLVSAILAAIARPETANGHTLNIAMDEPVDYGEVAAYLKRTRNLESVTIRTPYHSTHLDNSKAKRILDWIPTVDLESLIDGAWNYERTDNDPRKIWYPG